MKAAKMRMLRWMSGETSKDRIRNEHTKNNIRVAKIEDKMRENRLRWFRYVKVTVMIKLS